MVSQVLSVAFVFRCPSLLSPVRRFHDAASSCVSTHTCCLEPVSSFADAGATRRRLTQRRPRQVDLLFVAGTSLTVGPANSVVARVPETCARVVVNMEPVGAHLGVQYGAQAVRDVFLPGESASRTAPGAADGRFRSRLTQRRTRPLARRIRPANTVPFAYTVAVMSGGSRLFLVFLRYCSVRCTLRCGESCVICKDLVLIRRWFRVWGSGL